MGAATIQELPTPGNEHLVVLFLKRPQRRNERQLHWILLNLILSLPLRAMVLLLKTLVTPSCDFFYKESTETPYQTSFS